MQSCIYMSIQRSYQVVGTENFFHLLAHSGHFDNRIIFFICSIIIKKFISIISPWNKFQDVEQVSKNLYLMNTETSMAGPEFSFIQFRTRIRDEKTVLSLKGS